MRAWMALLLVGLFSNIVKAESTLAMPKFDGYLAVEAKFQDDSPEDGSNGFYIANARVGIRGDLKGGYEYKLKWDFVDSSLLIDGFLSKNINEHLKARAGKFKVPFSKENMTSEPDIDMINRAQIVDALKPGRRVGVELSGDVNAKKFFWIAGVFSDTKEMKKNAHNDYIGALRFGTLQDIGKTQLEFAINGAHSTDDAVKLEFATGDPIFSGQRILGGADTRWTCGRGYLASEILAGWLDGHDGSYYSLYGYHVTTGYQVSPGYLAQARWDSFMPINVGPQSDVAVASLAIAVPGADKMNFQIDYEHPIKDANKQKIYISLDAQF